MRYSDRVILSANRADDMEEDRISMLCDALKQIIDRSKRTELFINLIELRDHKGELTVRWAKRPSDLWVSIVNKAWEDQCECLIEHYVVVEIACGIEEDVSLADL